MKSIAVTAPRAGLKEALLKVSSIKPQVAIVFATPGLWKDEKAMEEACATLQGCQVLGCSTAGEILGPRARTDSISALGMRFDTAQVKVAEAALNAPEESFYAGQMLGKGLNGPKLRGVFVLSPGLRVNGSALAKGLAGAFDKGVVVSGCMAGDGTSFANTFTLLNGRISQSRVVAFGVYGDHVTVKHGSRCGWKSFGPLRRVTRAAGNVLFELDGKPALALYREYLGDKAAELPASGLLYPLSVMKGDSRQDSGIVRTLVNVNPHEGSLVLAGEVAQGAQVRLMHVDTDTLIEGAGLAGRDAGIWGAAGETATLMVSCLGRKLALGSDVDEEVEAVHKAIGGSSACAGIYGYGAFSPTGAQHAPELQNQSMAVTHIVEAGG
ncbi:MAG: FIST signal transduction protein [Alphaproteobacteria bacterium]